MSISCCADCLFHLQGAISHSASPLRLRQRHAQLQGNQRNPLLHYVIIDIIIPIDIEIGGLINIQFDLQWCDAVGVCIIWHQPSTRCSTV